MTTNKLSDENATLIVGCGYLGKTVACGIIRDNPGALVYATTRSADKADQFKAAHVEPIIADWTDRRTLARLPQCRQVLVAVSYDARSGRSREESQVGGLANLLDFLPSDADICYISTTGVFHQTDGSWVDENSPARPRAEGGLAHLRAEALLHRRRPQGMWSVLRLAGIYGPGRVPRASDVIAGRPIEGPHGGFLNLIHVEDGAQAVIASWQLGQRQPALRSRLYLVADDKPVIRRAFYEQIAKMAKVAPPTFTTEQASPSASRSPQSRSAAFLSSRSGSNKRIWNRRFRRDLMPRLSYPDYVAGLAAIGPAG